ncbi:MAG: putative manganese-dependent inorganic diphosphatase [bacterium]|nr:putative manganese-dependent inorganic diphosphatase [bacterium]
MDPNTILVIGHKNPDTDSIVSAIAYTHLKNALGTKNILAAAAGELNRETRFVLEHFGVEPLPVIEDIHLKVEDVMDSRPTVIETGAPFKNVLEIIEKEKVMMVPVVAEGELKGIIGVMEIADSLVAETDIETSRRVNTTVENILHCLGGTLYVGDKKRVFTHGNLMVGAMAVESLTSRLRSQFGFDNIILMGDRPDAQRAVIEAGAKCLIITGGFIPEQEIVERAKELEVVMITSPHDTITSVRLVKLSATVDALMDRQVAPLNPGLLLKEAIGLVSHSPTRSLPVVDENNQVIGVVTGLDLSLSRGRRVILMDHNEESQAVDGILEAEVMEVIDHHKIGRISSLEPIFFTCEPVGSTATLVAEKYEKSFVSPPPQIAGLLLAGIISDTFLFRASTTTDKDRRIAEKLALAARIEIEKLGKEMFHHAVDEEKPAIEIILSDYKEYELSGKKLGVGQMQVFDNQDILNRKERFKEELSNLLDTHKLELAIMIISDILRGGSTVFFAGNEQIMKMAFDYTPQAGRKNEFFLKDAFSRKKDFLPLIGRTFKTYYR